MNKKVLKGEFWKLRSRKTITIGKKGLLYHHTQQFCIIFLVSLLSLSCHQIKVEKSSRLMPGGNIPSKLFVLEVQPGMNCVKKQVLDYNY